MNFQSKKTNTSSVPPTVYYSFHLYLNIEPFFYFQWWIHFLIVCWAQGTPFMGMLRIIVIFFRGQDCDFGIFRDLKEKCEEIFRKFWKKVFYKYIYIHGHARHQVNYRVKCWYRKVNLKPLNYIYAYRSWGEGVLWDQNIWGDCQKSEQIPRLNITAGHRTMSSQIWYMTDQIIFWKDILIGHFIW